VMLSLTVAWSKIPVASEMHWYLVGSHWDLAEDQQTEDGTKSSRICIVAKRGACHGMIFITSLVVFAVCWAG
jgi:hypothetical protein